MDATRAREATTVRQDPRVIVIAQRGELVLKISGGNGDGVVVLILLPLLPLCAMVSQRRYYCPSGSASYSACPAGQYSGGTASGCEFIENSLQLLYLR